MNLSPARRPLLLGVVGLVVVVGVLAVVSLRGDSRPSQAQVEQDRLNRGQTMVDEGLRAFADRRHHPAEALSTTRQGYLQVGGSADADRYSPGLPKGIGVGFYRRSGDAFAYCLTSPTRHLVVQQQVRETDVLGGAGACPRASVRPVRMNN